MGKKRQQTGSEPARVFFANAFKTIPGYIELRAFKKGEKVHRTWTEDVDDAAQFVAEHEDRDVYYGVGVRAVEGGTKNDVGGTTALWAEFDTEKFGLDDIEEAAKIFRWPEHIRPSCLVHSGHGLHLYWYLEKPLTDIDTIETCNKVLGDFVPSDNIWNADRILRVPGSLNHKGSPKPCYVGWQYPWRRFDPDTLTQDILDTNAVLWTTGEFISTKKAKKLRAEMLAKATGDDPWLVGMKDRRKSVNGYGAMIWRRTKYGGGNGWHGIDEAITYYTAHQICRGEYKPEKIVEDCLQQVRHIHARDAANETWNWEAEEQHIWKKLKRWQAKWEAIQNGRDGRKKIRKNASGGGVAP